MSSPYLSHSDHPDHANPSPDPAAATAERAGHVRQAKDEVVHAAHHSVKHHLRNTRSSAQAALSHAREALQLVASSAQVGSQPIAGDLKAILNELDHALQALKADSSDQVANLRQALQEYADRIRQVARDGAIQVRDGASRSVDYTQQRVAQDPLKAISLAAGAGVLLGLWLGHCARGE